MKHVDIRFYMHDWSVDEATTEKMIQEFVMGKFSFIEAIVPIKTGKFGRSWPDDSNALTRADRPVKPIRSGEEV